MAIYGTCGCEEYCRHDEEQVDVSCKVCGSEAGVFYRLDGEIIGCEECLEVVSHRELQMEIEEEREAMYAGL